MSGLPFIGDENDFAGQQLAALAKKGSLEKASNLIPMSQRLRGRCAQPNLLGRADESDVEPKCKSMARATLENVKIDVYICRKEKPFEKRQFIISEWLKKILGKNVFLENGGKKFTYCV